MSKALSVVTYRSVTDPQRFNAYAALAGPAMEAAGARFIARGLPVSSPEGAQDQRTAVIEFESAEAAEKAYQSDAYQRALKTLGNGAIRDYRIVPVCES